MIDPIVVNIKPPRTPFRLPSLPKFSDRATKLITVSAAVVISISMVIFVVFSAYANTGSFKKEHHIGTLAAPTTGTFKSDAALPGGGTATGVGGTTGANSPVITLTATPSTVVAGAKSHLTWSVTNNPKSCTASDDWSGERAAKGDENTLPLTKVQTYLYTLTCKNATGTGFASVSVGSIGQGGSGGVNRPTVTLALNPSTIYAGDKSTVIWNATNNPAACTASGDWSGTKINTGSENTAQLTTIKSYSYTLTCTNSAGSGYATATLSVGAVPANIPNITISTSAFGTVVPGSNVTLTWNVTNNPAACTASGDWSGAKAASGTQLVGPLQSIKTYSFKLTCTNSAGSSFDSGEVVVIPGPPVVSLVASPVVISQGSSATLTWNATNSPSACTASGDWSGAKAASGSFNTGALNTARTYSYSLSCDNAGGTGFANNISVKVVSPVAPTVSLSASPISVTTGGSATLTWNTTNSPSFCTASGDWIDAKAASGTLSTGALNTARTYTYTLTCSNAGGSGSATTTVTAASGAVAVTRPVVTIAVSPLSIGTGSAATLSWSASNNPSSCAASGSWSGAQSASGSSSTGPIASAGSYVYSLACSNGAGTGTASATLSVIATPVVSLSVTPSSIAPGETANLVWSVSNSPSSCTAGGSWTGVKASAGSQPVSQAAAGTYDYLLSCTNSGGTASATASLIVAAPTAVYCSGQTPCYGNSQMAAHASIGSCWGYNLTWAIDITSYAPHHKGGTSAGSLESPSATCNHDLHNILAGSATIPGYRDGNGSTAHSHASTTTTNGATSALKSYFTGYYDSTKP